MSTIDFMKTLSKDYLSALDNADFCDVIIRVGEGKDIKEFKTHSFVLRTRSPYFRAALSDIWVKKQDNQIIFEKPNIHPEVFELILK